MQVKPSRLMNERRGLMGLNEVDFVAAGVFFILCSMLLSNSPYMLLAFPLTGLPLLILSPIRMKYRRKILRDFIAFKCSSGVLYDPRSKKPRS